MIASLRGVIIANTKDVIVECQGVGYGVHVSRSDSAQLIQGKEATLYIYEHIKEDAYDLYGFLSPETKELFELLLSVKNVGPKSALALLDIGSPADVRLAIAGGDIKHIQTAKGVGKRAAEQIIVELRDKVGVPVGVDAENLVYRSGVNQADEALQALVALGYSEADALTALQNIDANLSVEQRIKQALRGR